MINHVAPRSAAIPSPGLRGLAASGLAGWPTHTHQPVPCTTAARSVSMSRSIYSDTAKPTPPAPQTLDSGTDVVTEAAGSTADGQRAALSDLDTGRCQPATESVQDSGRGIDHPTRATDADPPAVSTRRAA